MSRSGYSEDYGDGDDHLAMYRYRGAVQSAINGRRGQAFLREMIAALDAMPVKELHESVLVGDNGCVCAMGAVAVARGTDVSRVDPEDSERVAKTLGIAEAMAREIAFENDDDFAFKHDETPAQRWVRMRAWAAAQIKVSP